MATLLRGARVVDLEPALVETADLRIEGDRIVDRAPALEETSEDELIDVSGKLLFPGLVSAWHQLSAVPLRGAPRDGLGFRVEQQARHRVDETLTVDELEAVTAASALEGLLAGTTTVFGLHRAATGGQGSLSRVAQGLNGVGLRAVLASQVHERGGAMAREAIIEEDLAWVSAAKGRLRGAFAVDGLGSFSDEGLQGLKEAHQRSGALLLATLAEDPLEDRESRERFGATVVERLATHGLTGGKVVLGQGVHLSWPELSQLIGVGSWLVHCARSNMFTQAGLATPSKFGLRGCFGTDVLGLDVFAEAASACLRATDSGQPIDVLRFLANGHRLASEAFGLTIGPLRPGSVADLLVLDVPTPTPFETETLAAQLVDGVAGRTVESVMVDGLWRMWKRKPLGLDVPQVLKRSAEATRAVWSRLK